ncbi:heparan-alpha-glucosaminide N-acetyltransferase domain-containing protein [Anaerovorax odorimutans]|uniref:Heparan-alpha-glucosaminide N-acetyltransferase domain-containing protein n=1 Tax=Anaerovorax odorimutans TaxID=109327 RepID=A0ABT1RKN4_9FIRM|nr:acyltransferase family protein [Anaerovorax odorimutans]MCQ4635730.1 heparan-alpha-glucosaminide N-acetyltransferase domain-containing protein [Anaerovorax odorimutans]
MNQFFKNKEINTGRQEEFDCLKALFLCAIFFIHAFQLCGVGNGKESALYEIVYIVSVTSGAPIYIFIMGMGTSYSRKTTKQTAGAGVRWIILQYLNNLGYIAGILLALGIMSIAGNAAVDAGLEMAKMFLPYINIFFLAGALYLILALMRACKAPIWLYPVLAVATSAASPFLVMQKTGVTALDTILSPLLGGESYTSFCVLPYIVFAFMGVFFGEIIKRVSGKKKFYLRLMPVAVLIAAAYIVYTAFQCEGLKETYNFMGQGYIYPDLFRALTNLSVILILAAIFYFLRNAIQERRHLSGEIKYLSKHISKYYAVHPCIYLFLLGLVGFEGQSAAVCCLFCVITVAATAMIVRIYNRFAKAKELEQRSGEEKPA